MPAWHYTGQHAVYEARTGVDWYLYPAKTSTVTAIAEIAVALMPATMHT